MGIEARTSLRRSARQVTVSHNLRLRKKSMQASQHIIDTSRLLRRKRVARFALLVQSTLVADADGASIIRSRVSTHLQQEAMLRQRAILTDIEMIPDVIEATLLVVTAQLFYTIVLIASGSRAMQHQKSHGVGIHHQLAVLHSGEERALIAHQLLTDGQREILCNHSR